MWKAVVSVKLGLKTNTANLSGLILSLECLSMLKASSLCKHIKVQDLYTDMKTKFFSLQLLSLTKIMF